MKSTTITPEGRKVRRWLIGLGVGIVVVNLVNLALMAIRPTEVVLAPPGSSYGTNPQAHGAWNELLDALGSATTRLGQPLGTVQLGTGRLDSDDTLVIMEPGFWQPDKTDVERLVEFLVGGGRLVLGGPMPIELVDAIFEEEPVYSFNGPAMSTVLVHSDATAGVGTIASPGYGAFDDSGSSVGLAGAGSQFSLLEETVGQGTVIYVADAAVLSNQYIGRADNALLAVSLAGGRRVVFDEYVHGFGGAGFWSNVPPRWQTTIWLLSLALVVWMIAVGRRFGPPESERRDLPPERRTYVDALGSLMARAKQPDEARAMIQRAAQRELLKKSGSMAESSEAALVETAKSLGLEQEDVDQIFGGRAPESKKQSEDGLISVDRVLARISGARE